MKGEIDFEISTLQLNFNNIFVSLLSNKILE